VSVAVALLHIMARAARACARMPAHRRASMPTTTTTHCCMHAPTHGVAGARRASSMSRSRGVTSSSGSGVSSSRAVRDVAACAAAAGGPPEVVSEAAVADLIAAQPLDDQRARVFVVCVSDARSAAAASFRKGSVCL
jgi:hypothetical protein